MRKGSRKTSCDGARAEEDDAHTEDAIYDYGTDSIGRKYPRDRYGHRLIKGSRRPKGSPPEAWKLRLKHSEVKLLAQRVQQVPSLTEKAGKATAASLSRTKV